MTKNLLELVKKGEIAATGAQPKLPTTIPNLTDNMLKVYRIPLSYLYFNDENGRISTQMKREGYQLTPQIDEVDSTYNDKIATFIAEDNQVALKKTKTSIKEKGQQVYGYVLNDGRVIDGNRRFTALRQIQKETETSQYFEAVILPFTYDAKAERAQIKRLELSIQMGTEEKLSYDPVDLSVDIYQTIVEDRIMTEADYAREANMKPKEVKDRIKTVALMKDFLSFINASEDAYYIIKDVKLYNPIFELAKVFSKNFPDKGPKYEQTKNTAFVVLGKNVATGSGDTVREIREYSKNIIASSYNDDFNDSVEDAVDDFMDKMEETPVKDAADFKAKLDRATVEIREVVEEYTTVSHRQNRGKTVDSFMSDIQRLSKTLQDLKRGNGLTGNLHFNNFSKDQIIEIRDLFVKINMDSADLIEVYEDEL